MISEEEMETYCPYCNSPITLVCENHSGAQTYVEDCEVCCRPIQISYLINEDLELSEFQAKRSSD